MHFFSKKEEGGKTWISSWNEAHHGLELSFPQKPSQDVINQLKEQGFRWHLKRQIWFAKDTTDRRAFLNKFLGVSFENDVVPQRESSHDAVHGESAVQKPNTFAAHYDSIGDARILTDANTSLLTYTEAYFEDLQCRYQRTYGGDCITMTDLSDAGKVGKTCRIWRVYPESYGDQITDKLHNEENINTCEELYHALKEGPTLSSVRVSVSDEKAVEI